MNLNEFVGNRTVVIKALVGSHNYNLATEKSDKDYKYFVLPSFEDLYNNIRFSNSITSPELDASCHDVRKLVDLLWNANLNFIEILFSREQEFDKKFDFLLNYRHALATMNLPYFYNATYGMHHEKMKNLYKGTETTAILVEKFGYDTKQACHALRCLYVLYNVIEYGDMGKAIWNSPETKEYKILMSLKEGYMPETEFHGHVAEWKATRGEFVKNWYMSKKPDEALYLAIRNTVKNIVKENLE